METELRLNNKKIATFRYRKTDNSVKKYIKDFKKEYKRLSNFFKIDIPPVNIHFIYKRETMDKYWGKKSPDWLCALSKKELVYIFSPQVFEDLSTHSKEGILPTITHETAHIFVRHINKKCFSWINEGICQYLETDNPEYKKVKPEDIDWFVKNNALSDPKIKWSTLADHGGYRISNNIMKDVIEKHGRQKAINLIKIKREGNKKDLRNKLENIINKDINSFLQKSKWPTQK